MNNEINAFGEGVTEGGLRNTTQIKILIEYIVDSLKDPITPEMAVEAVTANNLANYFEVSQAVSELVESQNLSLDDENFLHLSPKGADSLRELINDLPASVKERGLADAAAIQIKRRNAGSNKAVIVKSGEGYNVICTVLHKDSPVMSLTVYTADFAQAENVKNKFMEDPSKVYSEVISTLFG
jgi:predicted transcriptional regulator